MSDKPTEAGLWHEYTSSKNYRVWCRGRRRRSDLSEIIAWLATPNRKPPELAFSSGPTRGLADLMLAAMRSAESKAAPPTPAVIECECCGRPESRAEPYCCNTTRLIAEKQAREFEAEVNTTMGKAREQRDHRSGAGQGGRTGR